MNPWIEVDGGVGPKNAYKVCLLEARGPFYYVEMTLCSVIYWEDSFNFPRIDVRKTINDSLFVHFSS